MLIHEDVTVHKCQIHWQHHNATASPNIQTRTSRTGECRCCPVLQSTQGSNNTPSSMLCYDHGLTPTHHLMLPHACCQSPQTNQHQSTTMPGSTALPPVQLAAHRSTQAVRAVGWLTNALCFVQTPSHPTPARPTPAPTHPSRSMLMSPALQHEKE